MIIELFGRKKYSNMVFRGKIPDEIRALVRTAQKYEGMKQRQIMEKFGFSRSTIYRILTGFKRLKSCDA